ncbi:DMT family transporter [Elioraea thermophila]|uniref:DMT family transporter n=1 Tax=Elioraea thermophila TaxID=2185104 RepID=UPI001E5ACB24|nr:DMT family transporter [Elioraea thermophila]
MIRALFAPSADEAQERRLGFLLATGVLVIWTGFILASRAGAKGALTSWDMAALRFGVSFVALLPAALMGALRGVPLPRIAALTATAGYGFALLAYAAFEIAPAAHGAVLLPGALPFVTTLLAFVWLGEPISRRRKRSLALIAIGIVLLAGLGFFDSPGAWRGDVLFFLATSSWAVFTILVQRWQITALQATTSIAIGCAPLYLPLWWFALPSNIHLASWGEILFQGVYQGLLAMAFASLIYNRALIALGPVRLSLFTSVVPALAAVAAWPLLGEPLGWGGALGVLAVTAGMILGVRGGRVDVALPRP